MEPEEFEHIPWSNLLSEHRRERGRSLYLAAGIVIALAVGALGARLLFGGDAGGGEPSQPPPEPVQVAPTIPSSLPPDTIATAEEESLPSEADLMAFLPAPEELLAVARAEWFVSDYFTIDGAESGATDVTSAFVGGADVPTLPHSVDQAATSYVEWARAFRVNQLGGGSYAVGVLFRTLYTDGEGEFRRSGVRAVEVEIAIDGRHSGVGDLPMPIPPPFALDLEASVTLDDPARDEDVAEALDYAYLFDSDPAMLEATAGSGDWRVVLGIEDASGIEWPMVVRRRLLEAGG